MTQDVRQWLAEIQYLQQKLDEAHKERDQAFASAANWRSLYETEAQQRRAEAIQAQQTVAALRAEISRFKGRFSAAELPAVTPDYATSLGSVEALQQELLQVLQECDRLAQALELEQASHTQTRKTLTSALGDTVDLLAKERATQSH